MNRIERGPNTHWHISGRPKAGFTKEEALEHAAKILGDDLDAGRFRTHPSAYPCGTCDEWHVGNFVSGRGNVTA